MTKQTKPDKGTEYTESDSEQRSYFLPKGMGDLFKASCQGNASAGARGAFLLSMAAEDFPTLREKAVKAAEYSCPSRATIDRIKDLLYQEVAGKLIEAVRNPQGLSPNMMKIRERLMDEVSRTVIAEYVRTLPESEQAKLMAEARRKAGMK